MSDAKFHGLSDLRVIDFSTGIAGAYATRLFADAGADVVKVEAAGGDPLRRRSATGAPLGDADGAFFRFLAGGKRSVTGTPDDPGVEELVAGAVWSAQSEPTEPEDALEVGEQHLDLLAPVP